MCKFSHVGFVAALPVVGKIAPFHEGGKVGEAHFQFRATFWGVDQDECEFTLKRLEFGFDLFAVWAEVHFSLHFLGTVHDAVGDAGLIGVFREGEEVTALGVSAVEARIRHGRVGVWSYEDLELCLEFQ